MRINLLSRPCRAKKVILMTFFLMFVNALSFAQISKVYASSQTKKVNGLCVGCSITNPENAIGNDENSYSALKIPLSLLNGKIEQTLIFPAVTTRHFRKVVIGIGTANSSLPANLQNKIKVETFSGSVSNGDLKGVDATMLKFDQTTKRGTIEFVPAKYFDRVRIELSGGLIDLADEFRIYYGYHAPAPFSACGNPPLDPLAYYSLDGNLNDAISGLNLGSSLPAQFQDNLVCNKGLEASGSTFSIPPLSIPSGAARTISFWGQFDEHSGFEMWAFGAFLSIYPDQTGAHFSNLSGEEVYLRLPDEGFNNYTIVFSDQKVCAYLNGLPAGINAIGCLSWQPGGGDPYFKLINAKIDEVTVYDRELLASEIYALQSVFSNPTILATKTTIPQDTFTVSPNPTKGQITLDGNIPLEGSEISISNISGKEVYRSAFRTKTFELPDVLPGGIYILNLQTKEGKIFSRKIILSR